MNFQCSKKTFLGFALMAACLSYASVSKAGPQNICSDPQLEPEQAAQFSKIKLWLDHLKAEKGTFSQIDQNGKQTTGKFALQRPNQMRFDYDGKDGIHIIGNEGKIAYTDPSVSQVTFVPMDKTPLGLLFGKNYGWEGICLQKMHTDPKQLSVTLAQKSNPAQGNITLNFQAQPLQLSGWRIEDMQGNVTEISLENTKSVSGFSSRYFKLPKQG